MLLTVTPQQLAEQLAARAGATFITLFARTQPKMLVKSRITGEPNPFKGDLCHEFAQNVTFGADRDSAIMRRWAEVGELDATFTSGPLWKGKGHWINPYMRKHDNGTVYLAYLLKTYPQGHALSGKPLPNIHDAYKRISTGEVVDIKGNLHGEGGEDDHTIVEHFFPAISPSKKQREPLDTEQAELFRDTWSRTVMFENLVQINMDHNIVTINNTVEHVDPVK